MRTSRTSSISAVRSVVRRCSAGLRRRLAEGQTATDEELSGMNFFVEGIYRSTESTLVRNRREDDIDVVSVGVIWKF